MPKHQIYTIDVGGGGGSNRGIRNHAMVSLDDEHHSGGGAEILRIEQRPGSSSSDDSATSDQMLYQRNLDVYVKSNNNNNNNSNSLLKKSNMESCRRISIHRPALDLTEFTKQTGCSINSGEKKYFSDYVHSISGKLPTPCGFLTGLFPILKWAPKYNVRNDLFMDIVAGITVAILHIPQGIAYSLLAGLDPVHGLYVSFFPVLIYCLMGTSPHISVGTFAIASIMLNNIATKLGATNGNVVPLSLTNSTGNLLLNATLPNVAADGIVPLLPPTTLEVLTSVCLLCGVIQIVMGFLRLGSLSLILSEQLVSAYSTAIAFHVATSQFVYIFGFEGLPRVASGPFKLYRSWKQIFEQLHTANLNALILAGILITILVLFKEFIEPRVKRCCSFPVPIDLIVVTLSILFSWMLKFNDAFHIQVVKTVPTGLPEPKMPRLDLIPDVFLDTCILAIVCFAVSLSLAKIFAKKHKHTIDANQELIALGSSNLFASFFLAFPCSAALSRSTLQEKVGGRTQIAGFVSSGIILAVLLLLAPYLYHLPKCTLSCIILVALKGMFMQLGDLSTFWRISRLDGFAWLVTFASTIILDIDLGLIVGISVSVIVILVRLAVPKMYSLGNLECSEIYSETKGFPGLDRLSSDCRIFRFASPLFYMNTERFKNAVLTQFVDSDGAESDGTESARNTPVSDVDDSDERRSHRSFDTALTRSHRTLILDLSGVSFIDKAGIDALVEVVCALQERRITTKLAAVPLHVLELLESVRFLDRVLPKTVQTSISCRLYPTVHDAVIDSL